MLQLVGQACLLCAVFEHAPADACGPSSPWQRSHPTPCLPLQGLRTVRAPASEASAGTATQPYITHELSDIAGARLGTGNFGTHKVPKFHALAFLDLSTRKQVGGAAACALGQGASLGPTLRASDLLLRALHL